MLVSAAKVAVDGAVCALPKRVVDPPAMGRGRGARLSGRAIGERLRRGAARMTVEADPDAPPFHERMGARLVGTARSGSISGRVPPPPKPPP